MDNPSDHRSQHPLDRPSSPAGAPSGMPIDPIGVALPDVKSHTLWAILSTLFCCMPTGIVAMVYASQVMSAMNAGDGAAAMHASKRALWWSIGGPIAWLVLAVVVGVVELGLAVLSP